MLHIIGRDGYYGLYLVAVHSRVSISLNVDLFLLHKSFQVILVSLLITVKSAQGKQLNIFMNVLVSIGGHRI